VVQRPVGLHGITAAYRAALERGVDELGSREAGLVLGLTIGDTSGLGHVIVADFRAAGLAHILAVSGSNVAIILAAVLFVTRRTTAWFRLASGLVVLSMYVLVVGPDPSVLRAAVSAVVVIVAYASGFRAQPLHALGLALLILLTLRPQLFFAAGLHLSVAATVGILLWTGPLAERLRRLPRALRLGAAATLAAQVGVAPVLIATFGELSLAGPAANALALPAVGPATVLGLVSGAVALVNVDGAHFLARAAQPFLQWILWVGETFGQPTWASVSLHRLWALPVAVILLPAIARGVTRCIPVGTGARA
ncbi:MAG: ComEC/Rec2 family competence protein, partial [Actinomycetota bacterium]